MDIQNLSYEEKVELYKQLQSEGIVGAYKTEKRAYIYTLFGEHKLKCKDEIYKAVANLADMMTVNYIYEKGRTVRKSTFLPLTANDRNRYEDISKAIVNAIEPYMDETLDKWEKFEDGLDKCIDCKYFDKETQSCERHGYPLNFGKIKVACYMRYKK